MAHSTLQDSKPTIALVHENWADASSWTRVIEQLQREGITVTAPPNNLRGPAADSAYLRAYFETLPGPIVLVAHSYGGFVITNAATLGGCQNADPRCRRTAVGSVSSVKVREAHHGTDGGIRMTRYLLGVTFEGGVVDTPIEEWKPEEMQAHLAYYNDLNRELLASGELVGGEILTGPDLAKVVTSDGATAPVVTDGPFAEFKEWLAGYQIVDVESEERAIEIAARVSAVPGPGGVPTQQPIYVRRIMHEGPSTADEWREYAHPAGGER